jgi:hypothetical protein
VNGCGDYVCPSGRLNCYSHRSQSGNSLPVKGRTYVTNGGLNVFYSGCLLDENNKGILPYDGIKMGKEFYKVDLSEATTDNPLNISTIYWSPSLVFDKDGKAEASFYTGDITGRFRIVVNGLAGDNLFYASEFIDVK